MQSSLCAFILMQSFHTMLSLQGTFIMVTAKGSLQRLINPDAIVEKRCSSLKSSKIPVVKPANSEIHAWQSHTEDLHSRGTGSEDTSLCTIVKTAGKEVKNHSQKINKQEHLALAPSFSEKFPLNRNQQKLQNKILWPFWNSLEQIKVVSFRPRQFLCESLSTLIASQK